ncbi:MAG TPA: DUF362 domain-containing protein, partial [Candidatus Marinimicrobia bacterium]|nr:DUF362 domain-containing protein [Candidatus Neomarinimicrobiota bacterium]
MTQNVSQPQSFEKSQVALIKCDNYEPATVAAAVRRGIDLLGGIEKFARAGEKIVLKPNLLSAHSPEENVTTHPAVIKAVAEILLERGVKVSIGDSATKGHLAKILQESGMQTVIDELDLTIADFENGQSVYSTDSIRNKKFTIARGLWEADGMFNVPKLKTHHLTRITACIKNLFGCVPGFLKPALHVALPALDDFCRMLVDLSILLKPRLTILDAIEAMEGNGPTSGNAYPLKLLAFSSDLVAIDSIVCHMIAIKPEYVRTNYWGAQAGLGKMNLEEIEILGDNLDTFSAPDFKVQRQPELRFNQAWQYRHLKGLVTNRPVIDAQKCKKCGECIDQCPQQPKALSWNGKM